MRISQSSSARLFSAVVFALLGVVPLLSQAQGGGWTTPRTPWGHPDLQGTWNVATLTPLERPENVGGRLTLTPAEAAEHRAHRAAARRVARAAEQSGSQRADRSAPMSAATTISGSIVAATAFTVDGQHRTSIIVDPPDGKIPPMTPSRAAAQPRRARHGRPADV